MNTSDNQEESGFSKSLERYIQDTKYSYHITRLVWWEYVMSETEVEESARWYL